MSKCNLHSRSFAKSLNELCVEPTPPVVAPPSPPLPPPLTFADLPQEFPLTRSVSTTTDIYNPSSSAAPLKRKQKRNMATNTQQLPLPLPLASVQDDEDEDEYQARLCGLKRGLRKTKDELFQEFCKRAGMRNKPKNIYFISSGEEPEEPPRRHSSNNATRNNASSSSSSTSNIRKDNNSSRDAHVEEAEEETENGFGHIRPTPAAMLDEDHLYVVGGKWHRQLQGI